MIKKYIPVSVLCLFVLMVIFSCSKGSCTLVYECTAGGSEYDGTTTIYDITENDCSGYADEFRQGDTCAVSSDWQSE